MRTGPVRARADCLPKAGQDVLPIATGRPAAWRLERAGDMVVQEPPRFRSSPWLPDRQGSVRVSRLDAETIRAARRGLPRVTTPAAMASAGGLRRPGSARHRSCAVRNRPHAKRELASQNTVSFSTSRIAVRLAILRVLRTASSYHRVRRVRCQVPCDAAADRAATLFAVPGRWRSAPSLPWHGEQPADHRSRRRAPGREHT